MRGTRAVATLLGSIAFTACRPSVPSTHPTFNRDIAPLVWEHCSGCHRPGQQAPFSLLSFQDVQQRSRLIVTATGRHIMPPWLPEPGYGAFIGERRLRSEDVERIAQWVKDGTPEGDLWLRLLPRTNADADILARSYVDNEMRKNVAAAERMTAEHPREARWRNELGARYLEAGRVQEGILEFTPTPRRT